MKAYEIVPLEREKWQGYILNYTVGYISHESYEVKINCENSDFNISFMKKSLKKPFKHENLYYNDQLFNPWWDDVKAWGITDNEKLLAAIETSVEKWSNRLRVTELWVAEELRRHGIATELMDIAINRAKEENRRAVILETQSHNTAAIGFYLDYGFTLIGFDSCAYRNNDLERGEVRMEFGIMLN